MERRLEGGNAGGAVLVDGTVRRPTGPWTPAVHALLGHLERRSFPGAPRVLGVDEQGREILTYLPGATVGGTRPWPGWVHSDSALEQVGAWLRGYHDAVRDFVPPETAIWRTATRPWQPGDIVGHNDAAPYNAVWQPGTDGTGRLVGFIDWDFAAPCPPAWDLAFTAFSWVPLHAREVVAAEGFTDFAGRPRRLRLLLDAYGWAGRISELLDATIARIEAHIAGLRALAADDPVFARLLDTGAADSLHRALAEIAADRTTLASDDRPPSTPPAAPRHERTPPREGGAVTTREPYAGLATTFDTAAELYELARPGYPHQLFADLATSTGLATIAARVLEIGAGTGQATRGLLERGWTVVALEPGREMAAVASRVLAGRGDVEVVVSPFERWDAGDREPFDLVVAATSWHWLDPQVAYRRAAELLRPGGHLAIVATDHVSPPDGDEFFRQVERIYDEVGMGDGQGGPKLPEAIPAPDVEAIVASGLFGSPVVHRYVWSQDYTAEEYLAVLSTYSGHIAASPQQRDTLFSGIRELIAARPSATVRKHYLNTLQVARAIGP